jgi:broad specificity phosphatase PhoE
MAKIYLVRHAQASFGLENYDQLSDLGLQQSTHIPRHFSTSPQAFYRGDMQRHAQTLQGSFPDAGFEVLKDLNEFDHVNVLKTHRPEKFMEQEFKTAMLKWMNDSDNAYTESFAAFEARCMDAIQHMMDKALSEKQKEIVAVTSGGFISLVLMKLLQLPQEKMIELNMNVANTSVTCLLFNREKISLSYFNNYSHLPKEMVTFR